MSGGEQAPPRGRAGVARGLSVPRGAGMVLAAMALASGLSACSQGGSVALAQQACRHVAASVEIYGRSQRDPGSPQSTREEAEAVEQLRDALPIAATAAGESSQWQALMTTLSESTRLPESELENALESQCAVATSNGSG